MENPQIEKPHFVTVKRTESCIKSFTTVWYMDESKGMMQNFTVRERLGLYTNQTLWKYLEIDEGTWITEGIKRASIVTVHDGSYMEELAPKVCSAAVVIFCKDTGRTGYVSIAEKMDHRMASNYREECLGVLLNSLILIIEAATAGEDLEYPEVTMGCDNMGVVIHGNDLQHRFPDKQPQADVL